MRPRPDAATLKDISFSVEVLPEGITVILNNNSRFIIESATIEGSISNGNGDPAKFQNEQRDITSRRPRNLKLLAYSETGFASVAKVTVVFDYETALLEIAIPKKLRHINMQPPQPLWRTLANVLVRPLTAALRKMGGNRPQPSANSEQRPG